MMKHDGDRVKIDISRDEWEVLLTAMGFAASAALKQNDRKLANAFIQNANAINEGNPGWTPYASLMEGRPRPSDADPAAGDG